jgi:glycerol-3-phosphate acyltransferase PlsY
MSVMTISMTPLMAALFLVLAALDISPWAYGVYAVGAAAIIVFRHRANIERILAGTEPQIGRGGDKKAAEFAATGATEESVPAGRP